jgi:hypothetical protein
MLLYLTHTYSEEANHGTPQLLQTIANVPNPIEEAKKGFGWMSAKACELARVETPEDVKNRKKQEERDREEEIREISRQWQLEKDQVYILQRQLKD